MPSDLVTISQAHCALSPKKNGGAIKEQGFVLLLNSCVHLYMPQRERGLREWDKGMETK